MIIKYILILFLLIPFIGFNQEKTEMKLINRGAFVPLYGSDSLGVYVPDFLLDVYPVTNEQYLEFVMDNAKWKRSKVLRLFADEAYLTKWKNDTLLGTKMKKNSPITNISWYAAKDYCACQGKRLPSIDEWEYAAMASSTKPNAQADSIFNQQIIESYEIPKTYLNEIGQSFKNYYGIYDLHGLVWEWTSDFNSVLISGESRQDVDTEKNLFCGSASINASNLMDYAAFMRYAFRGAIKANYNIQTLGFRCAKSIK